LISWGEYIENARRGQKENASFKSYPHPVGKEGGDEARMFIPFAAGCRPVFLISPDACSGIFFLILLVMVNREKDYKNWLRG
jgi:hypothetical protein